MKCKECGQELPKLTAGQKWTTGDCEFFGNLCTFSTDVSCVICSRLRAKAYDEGRASVEPREPAGESEFQEMARKYMKDSDYYQSCTLPWDDLVHSSNWGKTMSAIRTFYNATLDLAKKNIHGYTGKSARQVIEALKEKE